MVVGGWVVPYRKCSNWKRRWNRPHSKTKTKTRTAVAVWIVVDLVVVAGVAVGGGVAVVDMSCFSVDLPFVCAVLPSDAAAGDTVPAGPSWCLLPRVVPLGDLPRFVRRFVAPIEVLCLVVRCPCRCPSP